MFNRIMISLVVVIFSMTLDDNKVYSQLTNCSTSNQLFQSQTQDWVLQVFDTLDNNGRTSLIQFLMERAGCLLGDEPISTLITDCQNQLKSAFGCKVAISIMRDTEFDEPNIQAHCCELHSQCCQSPGNC